MKAIGIFGAGLLNLGGSIPALLSCSQKPKILITSSQKLDHRARDVFINEKKRYRLLPVTENQLSQLDSLSPNMLLYCERDNPVYPNVIASMDVAFFACRDGLKDYVADIEEIIKDTREFDIISIDNNGTFLKKAAACSVYDNIHYTHAVVHGAVTCMSIYEDKIEVNAGNPAEITLPPQINEEKIQLKKMHPHHLWQPKNPSINIAKSDAEFQLKREDKRTSINAQHSIQVVAALSKGIAHGYSIDEAQEKRFSDFMDFDEMIFIASRTHLVAYAYMLEKLQKVAGYKELSEDLLNYDVHFKSMLYFLRYTYDSGDYIKRGINIHKSADAKYKYESHIGALRESEMYYSKDEHVSRAIKILSGAGCEISDIDFRAALYVCKQIVTAADALFGKKL